MGREQQRKVRRKMTSASRKAEAIRREKARRGESVKVKKERRVVEPERREVTSL
jgi:hypothetical protein